LTRDTTETTQPDDRREVATAGRLLAMKLGEITTAEAKLTLEEFGLMLARRLDRAGLITRSE